MVDPPAGFDYVSEASEVHLVGQLHCSINDKIKQFYYLHGDFFLSAWVGVIVIYCMKSVSFYTHEHHYFSYL